MSGQRATRGESRSTHAVRPGTPGSGGETVAPSAGEVLPPSWRRLASELARAVAALDEECALVLETRRAGNYLRVTSYGEAGVHAESASADPRLGAEARPRLEDLGWQRPSTDAATPADEGEPVAQVWRTWEFPPSYPEVAAFVVRTLREGYRVSATRGVRYRAFAPGGREILFPTLGLSRIRDDHAGASEPALRVRVRDFLAEFTGIRDLAFDRDGDLPLRHGSAMVFVRIHEEPPMIELFSPVLRDVAAEPGLLEALNEINSRTRFVTFSAIGGGVVASHEFFAEPFVPAHLAHGLAVLSRTADEADDELKERFGGELFFDDEGGTKPPRHTLAPN